MTGQVLKRGSLAAWSKVAVVSAPPLAQDPDDRSRKPPGTHPESVKVFPQTDEAPAAELARIRAELQTLRSNAVEEGRAEGLKLGRKVGEHHAAEAAARQLEALHGLARALDAAARDLRERDRELKIGVVFSAACRLIGKSWATREGAAAAVQAVLSEANLSGQVTVQVSAADLDRLKAMAMAHPDPELRHVRFVAHPEVALGGCRVVTAEGLLDARLETQLALLEQALSEARSTESGWAT